MKKVIKNPIFMFILGVTMSLGIEVIAITLSAKDFKYSDTNVKEALDVLYERSSYQKYDGITTITPTTSGQILETNNKMLRSDIVINALPTYSNYTITPTSTTQTLKTKNKLMTDNIIIKSIPSTYKELTETTTFTANDIVSGKKAYNNSGQLITGTALSMSTTKVLLWENPNATNSIALSYLPINRSLTDFTHFLVIYKNYKTDTTTYENIFKVSPIRYEGFDNSGAWSISGKVSNSVYSRGIYYPSDGTQTLKIGDAYETAGGSARNNNYLIPVYIYGLNISY